MGTDVSMSWSKTNTIAVLGGTSTALLVGVTKAILGGGGGCATALKLPETVGSATPFVPDNGDDITKPPLVGGFNVQEMFEL